MKTIKRLFSKNILKLENMSKNPMQEFKKFYSIAQKSELCNINRMVLGTVSDNKPYTRWVDLRKMDSENKDLSFFTNYTSRKAQHIDKNNNVALCFFWPKMALEIKINGVAKKYSEKENEDYYNALPEMNYYTIVSQGTKKFGEDNQVWEFREKTEVYTNADENQNKIKLPENWGGYHVVPDVIEFMAGDNAFGERVIYEMKNGEWVNKKIN